jgi:hypothetical protein
MRCEYKFHWLATCIVIIGFMVTGCATTTTSLKFTQSEVKLIPIIAIQKVLSSNAMNETVKVNASSIDGPAVVKGYEGLKYVIVTDKRGKEIKLAISEITKIERVRRIKKPDNSPEKGESNTTEAAAEILIYAPLVPVAIATWPVLRTLGLDAGKNAEDNWKARLVYEGMSKEDLRVYVGEPKEKYYCEAKDRSGDYEIWVYEKDQVLRGGRALFINFDKGEIYHNSYHTSFFKKWDNCSVITQ